MSWASQPRHLRTERALSAWGLVSYVFLGVFISTFLLLGLLNSASEHSLGRKPRIHFPDFDKITTHTRVLSESDVGFNTSSSRVMFVGDVHGMNQSLHDLLDKLAYDPSHDTIFFAGDLLAKSTHSSSLAVIDFLTQHHAEHGRESIFPVRGNHDHMIVQWRAWRDWFEEEQFPARDAVPADTPPTFTLAALMNPIGVLLDTVRALTTGSNKAAAAAEDDNAAPPVNTGREFLRVLEHDWYAAQLSGEVPDVEEYVDVARKRARGTWREAWWARIPPPGKGRAKQQWRLFGDHYWLAKDLSSEQSAWLRALPLVNHVPHLHLFVVHAGLLPADSTRRAADRRQPLARIPVLNEAARVWEVTSDSGEDEDEEATTFFSRVREPGLQDVLLSRTSTLHASQQQGRVNATTLATLRRLQESAVVSDVPQNQDPWVVLNMRGVKKSGKVTRNGDKGRPWSDIWGEMMGRCDGFGLEGEDVDVQGRKGRKEEDYELLCYPATVIYGHAATRGLDVKRWSFGLDTGCLYGNKLTALVLRPPAGDDGEDDEVEETRGAKRQKKMRFGDSGAGVRASLVSVRCAAVDGGGDDDHDHDDDDDHDGDK